MPTFDQLISFLLAAFLHLLGLLLLGLGVGENRAQEEVAPELEVASLELTLTEAGSSAGPGGGGAAQSPVAPSSQAETPAQLPVEAPTPIELPQPIETPPMPPLPEKPSFADLLTPPPEPEPLPAPTPLPAPSVAPPAAPPAIDKPAVGQTASPTSSNASLLGTATLQPDGTGGSGGTGGGAFGHIDAQPSLERAIKPNYPIGARRRGEEGTVILDVTVASDGHASAVSLVASCGFSDLDKAAERAADQARFKPAKRDGKPIDSAARLTIIFRLRGQ